MDTKAIWATAFTDAALVSQLRAPTYGAISQSVYPHLKRCFDLFVTTFSLIMLLPIMLLIALAIMVESRGAILYRQTRIGLGGKPFTMYKFRTMVPDRRRQSTRIEFAERRCSLKSPRDPRITTLGRFLRRTSLDELPQLWNVLRGDMSLVGPRPEIVEMLCYYDSEHYLRHCVIPGLTGWWQINGRCRRDGSSTPTDDLRQKLADDLYYLEHQSFLFDVGLIFKTIPVVISRRGAV
jgi:lipopolysaccharide/colanic/teichoic acid biosynthesis glycosyltransferase